MKTIEIFSGAGGLAKGLELAGFSHKAFVEYNQDACSSLRSNYSPDIVHEGDIRFFNYSLYDGIDVIAGGPPCQPFSLGGKHKGFNDARDMFPQAIRAIDELQPKAFIFENVKGLLRSTFSEYFEYIIKRLTYPALIKANNDCWADHLNKLRKIRYDAHSGLKYHVQFRLINAADYGVPQQRERVFIVGIRSDLGREWRFPVAEHSGERLIWDKFVTGEYWDRHSVPAAKREKPSLGLAKYVEKLKINWGFLNPPSKPWKTIRDAIADLPDPLYQHNLRDHEFRGGARVYSGHTGSDYDMPAKTIKAGGHGVPGGENMIRYRDGSVRYFTVLEAKRIQTFPDGYFVLGSWGEAMRQIGNAVPVKLSAIMGEALRKTLKHISSERLSLVGFAR